MTVAQACALVDAWGPECNLGLHQIARTLRAAVRHPVLDIEKAREAALAARQAAVAGDELAAFTYAGAVDRILRTEVPV